MNKRIYLTLMIGLALFSACAAPTETPPTPTPLALPTQTSIFTETPIVLTPSVIATATGDSFTAIPTLTFTPGTSFTAIPAATSTSAPNPSNICADPQVTALLNSLKTAVLNSDGALLSSLVSPASGMDVRWVRYGTAVNYQPSQAQFLFETTFEVDWGEQPGSGEPKVGAFHDVIVPDLVKLFNQSYTLHCNELKYGGATYDVSWPYDKDFYSLHYPGSETYGNMDWHTWVVGIEYVSGKPYIYALTQFFWEP